LFSKLRTNERSRLSELIGRPRFNRRRSHFQAHILESQK
jgi:hypothetical protein